MGKGKLAIVAASVALVVGLIAGIGVPAFAADPAAGNQPNVAKARAINGKVTQIDPGKIFFMVQSGKPGATQDVKVAVDGNTKYFKVTIHERPVGGAKGNLKQMPPKLNNGQFGRGQWMMPGRGGFQRTGGSAPPAAPGNSGKINAARQIGDPAAFTDIAVGDRVMVRVAPGTDPPLAQQVLIFKVTPSPFKQITGNVSAVSGNLVTIASATETVTVTIDAKTHVVITGALGVQPGQTAHAVYDNSTPAKVAKMLRVKPA